MSQAGELDILSAHPEIPTEFITNSGNAIPLANTLEVLGETVANSSHTQAVYTVGSGNTLTVNVQVATELAASDITKVGLSSYDSAAFDVDINGFVQLIGGGTPTTSYNVQANTAPGTDPVLPDASGIVTVNGAAVANHSVVMETRSRAANTYNIEVQYATTSATTDATKSGVSHYNSEDFTVDPNGFVSTKNTSIVTQTFTSSGTYTPTTGMTSCIVEMIGGGGAGGGTAAAAAGQIAGGAGGGAGEYARGVFSAADIGASKTVTLGAPGAGANAANGGAGGTTSLGTLLTAAGGAGGNVGLSAVNAINTGASGGTGGAGTGIHVKGNQAQYAIWVAGSFQLSGAGANSRYGTGGDSRISTNNGINGFGFGSGGSGGLSISGGGVTFGGSGSNGFMIITEFVTN